MPAHTKNINALVEELNSDLKTGINSNAFPFIAEKYGKNKLDDVKKKSILIKFLEQFKDVMILILLAAAAVSFVLAVMHGEPGEFFEPSLIVLIVIINAIMGVSQENKAEKALDALKNLSAPHAKVIRDGKDAVIDAEELVPGDIILLEAGDFVPADARLISSSSLKSEESALTGESVAADKAYDAEPKEDSPLGDRTNMVYSGCSITYGTAKALVTATGMNTEMGKIAKLLKNQEDSGTPLQKKLAQLGKYLGIIALAACALIFVIGIVFNMSDIRTLFMTAVSLAVSAIPEGLPAVVTIVLAIGVQRMVKRNAIIRRLPAVETLGSASVICSDKTGTLTQNRMTLKKAFADGKQSAENITENNSEEIKKLLTYAVLCCNGSVAIEEGKENHVGDPTETSIVAAALRNGLDKDRLNAIYPRIAELPFDSDRKLMTTVHEMNGKRVAIVKGACDMLLPLCVKGGVKIASAMNEEMGKNALRVIGVAYKELHDGHAIKIDHLENNLTFLGLVGMIDPPRPEAKAAVVECRNAGIKPVMITGDHVVTASAIAKELGILSKGDEAVTGEKLAKMSDGELTKRIRNISVYARVSPSDKIRIVKAWQNCGEIVAMTGDGVNDAPALKAADIGCAMGITGTDVAKGAADITLTDDNFATIIQAVKEGRGIYDNIKKVVGYLLGTNVGEIFTVFFAMIIFNLPPLLSMQLLWINLVTDSLPAIALGMEQIDDDVMKRKPKPANESIFAHGFGLRIILQGIMFGGLTLLGYYLGSIITGSHIGAQTTAFIILALTQIVHSFNMRSERSLFAGNPFSNKNLNMAALAGFALMLFVVFVPGINTAFGLCPLPWHLYLIALGLAFVPLIVIEIVKFIAKAIAKKSK
ncbi:MAG: calcium-translocating P-type ATPase, PMCA-type [Clostridiales bacterium]|jgi:Ca2+-transporting ATPase|nr:calcium-translocating P-type ATPase, PMCA-type [Clostridiales bacterium]